MKSVSELNAAVTKAILDAESHDRDGATLWDRVAEVEKELAECPWPGLSPLEYAIAKRGFVTATRRAKMLREPTTDGSL